MKTTFLRVIEAEDKAAALLEAAGEPAGGRQRFAVNLESLANVPRSPFAYWVSDDVRRLFTRFAPFEAPGRTVKQGLATADDFRFVRGWWELSGGAASRGWFGFAKGGAFSQFYADVFLATNWRDNGAEMKAWTVVTYGGGHWSRNLRNPDYYFRPGVTWPLRTQSGFGIRAMPAGCVFGHKGPAAFVVDEDTNELLASLAVATSSAFCCLVELQMAFGAYEVGVIQRTPLPGLERSVRDSLAGLARRAWSLKRSSDTTNETSHAFILPTLLQTAGANIVARLLVWTERVHGSDAERVKLQAEIDALCFSVYGINDADRCTITEGFAIQGSRADSNDSVDDAPDIEEANDTEAATDATALASELVSWAVGVAFGRFDGRLATDARPMPPEPEPFDPLPACSPGMLTGDDGLPLAHPPVGYPLSFPESGVLVDDPGHALDLTYPFTG